MPTVQPVIPWMGGKRRLAKELIPLFPPHTCYVEVFCGAAALYFLKPEKAKVEVLNDINGELTNLYRVLQHHQDEFLRQFEWAISSRQMFLWHQKTNSETLTDIQRAARFFYTQQHAFGGKVTGQVFGTATTAQNVNFPRLLQLLRNAHLRLSGTHIEQLPWLACMKRYDRPHTFFYVDPPYWKTAGYGVPFPLEEYEQLAQFMRSCKGKVLLSINDHPDMRRVFAGFPMEKVTLKYSVGSNHGKPKASGELIVRNWE